MLLITLIMAAFYLGETDLALCMLTHWHCLLVQSTIIVLVPPVLFLLNPQINMSVV